MCGICGVVSELLSVEDRQAAVGRMCDAMVHRGPDDAGCVSLDGVTLGMRRLAILDLSRAGHQPMPNEDERLWLVFNGEIYNFASLRGRLEQRGHRFQSKTDSETVLHLYEDQGRECLNELRGMFGLAIWDAGARELLLARDRLGIKPLYYAQVPGGIAFASEIQALLASGLVPRAIDLVALDQYVSFGFVPPPRTMVAGVTALCPGHRLRVSAAGSVVERWWKFPEPDDRQRQPEDIVSGLRERLEESIRLHRISDVPVGAFLSGGIDSTAVVGLMARTLNESVRTFSVGFADGPPRMNELGYAAAAARAFGTEHTEVVITGADVRACFDGVIRHIDQPSFDGLNSYIVSRAAREGGVTVALSGLGGDEVFGGYDTYDKIPRWAGLAGAWGKVPRTLRRGVSGALDWLHGGRGDDDRARKLRHVHEATSACGLYALARLTLWPDDTQRLYTPDIRRQLSSMNTVDPCTLMARAAPDARGAWQLVSQLELTTFMGWRLLRDTDAMSMAHSLEVRVPLIDHCIVEFVLGLAPGWERQLGHPKRLLVQSLADILPRALVDRPKQGFAFPVEHWMRRELRPVVDDALSDETTRSRGLFEPSAIAALRDGFFAGRHPYPVVWQFVVLEHWLRHALDAVSVAEPQLACVNGGR